MIARSKRLIALTCFVLAGAVWSAYGTPSIAPDHFYATGVVDGWTILNPEGNAPVALGNPGTGGNADGYLQAIFPYSATPAQGDIVMQANPVYNGDYTGIQSVSFDFNSMNVVPTGLALYFHSSADPLLIYQYDFTNQAIAYGTGGWYSYTAPFTSSTGWSIVGGGSTAAFSTDIVNVDWIGVYLQSDGSSSPAEMYGMDNFDPMGDEELPVPEPGTMYMLSAVLLSLGMTFKGQLAGIASKFRSTCKA
jgi:hypothetical protein